MPKKKDKTPKKDWYSKEVKKFLENGIKTNDDYNEIKGFLSEEQVKNLITQIQEEVKNLITQIQEKFNEVKSIYKELKQFNDPDLEKNENLNKLQEKIETLNLDLKPIFELYVKCARFLLKKDENSIELFNLINSNNSIEFELIQNLLKNYNIDGKNPNAAAAELNDAAAFVDLKKLNKFYSEWKFEEGKKNNLFHFAVDKGNIVWLEKLLKIFDNTKIIDEKNNLGEFLLEFALKKSAECFIKYGHFDNEIVHFLIDKLSIESLSITNSKNMNVLHLATISGNIQAIKKIIAKDKNFLLTNGTTNEVNVLQRAIYGASSETTGEKPWENWIFPFYYFKDWIDINFLNNFINSPTAEFLIKNYEDIVKELLPILTVDQINAKDHDGDSPLHECVYRSNEKMLNLLLINEKVKINVQNNEGNTPLHLAVTHSRLPIIKIILQHPRIDLFKENNNGLYSFALISDANRTDTDKKEIALLFKQTFQKIYPGTQYPQVLDDIINNNTSPTERYVCDNAAEAEGYDTVDTNSLPINQINYDASTSTSSTSHEPAQIVNTNATI